MNKHDGLAENSIYPSTATAYVVRRDGLIYLECYECRHINVDLDDISNGCQTLEETLKLALELDGEKVHGRYSPDLNCPHIDKAKSNAS